MAKQPEMGEMPDVWSIYLSVEDADAVAAAVPANGGEVLMAPMDVVDLGRMAVFTDAGGAAIGARQPKEFKSFQLAFEDDTPAGSSCTPATSPRRSPSTRPSSGGPPRSRATATSSGTRR